jgi:ribosome-associated toxin RatA of RatAB toxin-antitoxin module
MFKNYFATFTVLVFLLSGGINPASANAAEMVARNKPWPFVNLPQDMNYNTLIPLLEKGEVNMNYFNKDGSYKQATVLCLIAAPPAKVWPNVVDFDNYPKYMPRVGSLGILKRDPIEPWVYYELEIPGPNYYFTVRVHEDCPRSVDFIPEKYKGADLTGSWRYELHPVDNGAKTVLVFKMFCDTRDQSWILRQVLKMDPTMEMPLNLGVNLSTGIINLQAIKRRTEATQ